MSSYFPFDNNDPTIFDLDRDDERDDRALDCPTCHGSGLVNPLTAPKDFFCVGTTDCPHCDGTGEI